MQPLSLAEFTTHLEQATIQAGYTIQKREGTVLYIVLHEDAARPMRLDAQQYYATYRANPDRLDDFTHAHLRALKQAAESARPLTETEASRAFLPMLQTPRWLRDAGKKALPPIYRPFTAEVIVTYVFDYPSYRAYVNAQMLAPLFQGEQTNLDALHAYALENLRQRTSHSDYEIHGVGDQKLIVCHKKDGFAATRLLLPDLMEKWAKQFPGDQMLIGIPNRDFLIAFSPVDPRHVQAITQQIRRDARWREHGLTPKVFMWEAGVLKQQK
ncbi:MAG: DUF1444 family protein [Anaerolineales bacterium]